MATYKLSLFSPCSECLKFCRIREDESHPGVRFKFNLREIQRERGWLTGTLGHVLACMHVRKRVRGKGLDAEYNVELEYKNTMTAKFVTAKSHLCMLSVCACMCACRVCVCVCVRACVRSHLNGWSCWFMILSSLDSADWRLRGDTAASAAAMKMDCLYSLRPAPSTPSSWHYQEGCILLMRMKYSGSVTAFSLSTLCIYSTVEHDVRKGAGGKR